MSADHAEYALLERAYAAIGTCTCQPQPILCERCELLRELITAIGESEGFGCCCGGCVL